MPGGRNARLPTCKTRSFKPTSYPTLQNCYHQNIEASSIPRSIGLPSLLATGRRLFMIMTSCGSATGSTSSATSANTFGPQTFPTSDKRETNKSSSLPKNSPDHYPMSAGTSTQDSHRMIYESGNLQQSVTS